MREMKVLLYAKNEKIVSRSGVGRAMFMQKNALKSEQVELTCDPREDFDIVHLNTVFPSDYHMAKKAKRSCPFDKGRFSKLLCGIQSDGASF